MYFIINYTKGELWLDGKPIYEQDLMEHGIYMDNLQKQNILLIGGPLSENIGGLAIIKVNDQKHADSILKNDPAIKNKVFKGDLVKYEPVFISMPNHNT